MTDHLWAPKTEGTSAAIDAAVAAGANGILKSVDHESILDNFDSFLKLAGTELFSLKDVAKNISGMGLMVNTRTRIEMKEMGD